MYNTARVLFSTSIGASMNKVGRKNYIIIGFILMIISTAAFGALYWIPKEQEWVFFGLALAARFVQGIGGTILQVAG
jgi:MFS family permease